MTSTRYVLGYDTLKSKLYVSTLYTTFKKIGSFFFKKLPGRVFYLIFYHF
ncbi:hypothetical protein HMPREF1548_02938 [Clostridium sp. KLE 1755]|nr:hypothetical protein HMPREF1548_02938 [Clostridium sp. KLE 1755]